MDLSSLSRDGQPIRSVSPSDRVIGGVRQYCRGCYSTAANAGRLVRATSHGEMCDLCYGRQSNGLVRYSPSNGTEGHMFTARCERCRHYRPDAYDDGTAPKLTVPGNLCAWAVLDRVTASGWEPADSAANWHQPESLRTRDEDGDPVCPAECLRYTPRGDPNGERRDPPPPDVVGQLTFGDVDVPVEPSPALPAARPEPSR